MNLKEQRRRLSLDIHALFIVLNDGRTPLAAKVCAYAAVAYALSPVDLIPDFIPVLGYLDDILILPLLVSLAVALIPKDVWKKVRQQAEVKSEELKGRWYYAVPVVVFYLAAALIVVKTVVRR